MTAVSELRFDIASDFSPTPGPRYIEEGEWSGQDLRERFLKALVESARSSGRSVLINLDGTAGFGTSFLEEAFGGLIREDGFNLQVLESTLKFKSEEEPYLIEDIWEYMKDAQRERA